MSPLSSLFLLSLASQPVQADASLVFYQGSTSVCRPDLEAEGLCKPSELTRCIVVRNQQRQEAKCSASGSALFVEKETGISKSVEDKVDLILRPGEASTVCFDYNRNLYNLWSFQAFERFSGSCGEKPVTVRIDAEKCASGWPCNKVEVKKASLKVDEKEASACLNYSNKNLKTQLCDLRLDLEFQGGVVSTLRRQEKLFYNQEQNVCFSFPEKSQGFVGIKDMGVVCRHLETDVDPSKVCDLGKELCSVETEQTLILTP